MNKHLQDPNLLPTIEELLRAVQPSKGCLLLYDSQIPQKVVTKIQEALDPRATFGISGGEKIKSIDGYQKIVSWLLQKTATSKDRLIVLGGGSLIDLGGFVASTYHRGMKLELIPSTLLAMVDASIGGKNGINIDGIKNVVGTIYQPSAIFICPGLLDSFSKEELLYSVPEMVKHALLDSESHFHAIEEHFKKGNWTDLIERSARFKSALVHNTSEKRDLLNLGHTIGHAIEGVLGPSCSHGSAVFAGLLGEIGLGVHLGLTNPEVLKRLEKLPLYSIFPDLRSISFDELFEKMVRDKKSINGKVGVVFIKDIGSPIGVRFVDRSALEYAWGVCQMRSVQMRSVNGYQNRS